MRAAGWLDPRSPVPTRRRAAPRAGSMPVARTTPGPPMRPVATTAPSTPGRAARSTTPTLVGPPTGAREAPATIATPTPVATSIKTLAAAGSSTTQVAGRTRAGTRRGPIGKRRPAAQVVLERATSRAASVAAAGAGPAASAAAVVFPAEVTLLVRVAVVGAAASAVVDSGANTDVQRRGLAGAEGRQQGGWHHCEVGS